ncbi:MAG: mannitol dehydrogenase family protein [Defluviitaleaceae bacterium]|nr:mannitol dehydrogenase family protein [Defluviitaleaceae bacterium]
MKLDVNFSENRAKWEHIDIVLPKFNQKNMQTLTSQRPTWIHFGAGNIFRGYIARLQQNILNSGKTDTGIIAVETFDYDIIDKIYYPYDNLALLVTLNSNGNMNKEIIASIAKSLRADIHKQEIIKIFENPSLQMASLTITEKGYAITDMESEFLPVILSDADAGPDKCMHIMSILTALCYKRYQAGAAPIALVSMDNCSGNGEKLRSAIICIARLWKNRNFTNQGFIDYLLSGKVSFPWSMIDKITPRPSEVVEEHLTNLGIENMSPIITSKNTFIAPFVNAEGAEYLVIEDDFPNGRPPLEKSGVYFTNRETVNLTETMKVTTCLNPLHTALAVFGCLLGYKTIADEMSDPDLRILIEKIGYDEGMRVVHNPGIIDPKVFIDEVINVRLPNPFIPDTPSRIATDTSQKMRIRFGKTIEAYLNSDTLQVSDLKGIPLTIAAWFRYLLGVDDNLTPIVISPDPMLEYLTAQLSGITAGKPQTYKGQLRPILCSHILFGLHLYDAGLGKKIEKMFIDMIKAPGAVRKALRNLNSY